MIKRLLKNKTGVTILEGLIALGLLAMVAGGTFGVLLSVSRKTARPDIREEMLLAVERANEQLQAYADQQLDKANMKGNFWVESQNTFENGLCGGDTNPLDTEKDHPIDCLLPAICNPEESEFYYEVSSANISNLPNFNANYSDINSGVNKVSKKVTFTIQCDGFTL